jgi:orotate phosphoribosyltransferase
MSERDYVRQVLDRHQNSLFVGTHVVLTSGRHSDFYFDKRVPLRDPNTFDAVVATAYGAITLAYQVALHLQVNGQKDIKFFIAEKAEGGGFKFNSSDAALLAGLEVLVVEDVNTTAGSTLETLDALDAVGAIPVAVTTLVDRSGERASAALQERDVMFVPILEMDASDWAADECQLCADDVPINTAIGHGQDFLASKS